MIETHAVDDAPMTHERVYRRDLPGAGYVEIDVASPADAARPGEQAPPVRTRLYVERRESADRRAGHEPPMLAEIVGDDTASATGELFRLATDNVALARALLDWQTRHQTHIKDA